MEESNPTAEALAIQFGRIYRVGKTAEIEKLANPTSKVIDLKGQALLPGFIDTHNHLCLYALLSDQADCRPAAGCMRGQDVVEALRAQALFREDDKRGRYLGGNDLCDPPGVWGEDRSRKRDAYTDHRAFRLHAQAYVGG